MTAFAARHVDAGLRAVRHRIRKASYLRRWVVLGAGIGVVGGIGAIIFYSALELASHLFLGVLAGYTPPTPAGEGGAPITDALRPWAIPLVVALGGLLSGIIVFRFAPEAEGHGTDAAIGAFHHDPRGIRARIPRGSWWKAPIAASVPCPSASGAKRKTMIPESSPPNATTRGIAHGRSASVIGAPPSPAGVGGVYPARTPRKRCEASSRAE